MEEYFADAMTMGNIEAKKNNTNTAMSDSSFACPEDTNVRFSAATETKQAVNISKMFQLRIEEFSHQVAHLGTDKSKIGCRRRENTHSEVTKDENLDPGDTANILSLGTFQAFIYINGS